MDIIKNKKTEKINDLSINDIIKLDINNFSTEKVINKKDGYDFVYISGNEKNVDSFLVSTKQIFGIKDIQHNLSFFDIKNKDGSIKKIITLNIPKGFIAMEENFFLNFEKMLQSDKNIFKSTDIDSSEINIINFPSTFQIININSLYNPSHPDALIKLTGGNIKFVAERSMNFQTKKIINCNELNLEDSVEYIAKNGIDNGNFDGIFKNGYFPNIKIIDKDAIKSYEMYKMIIGKDVNINKSEYLKQQHKHKKYLFSTLSNELEEINNHDKYIEPKVEND